VCPPGEIICQNNEAMECDGAGGYLNIIPCDPDICVEGIGCAECEPGTFQCNGDTVEECTPAGDAWLPIEDCDPLQGMICNDILGYCTGPCAPAFLGLSYIGCDYYPTVTSNSVDSAVFNFAVAVSNTTAVAADVTITSGAAVIASQSVAANSLELFNLPWQAALKGGDSIDLAEVWPTIVAVDGAYRVRSTQPVTVYQYSPLEYEGQAGSCTVPGDPSCSYTNDASLLLPTNAWQNEYAVASRNGLANQIPGFYAVVARDDDTTVELFPSATGGAVVAGAGVAANGTGTVTLNEGDVLEVYSTESEAADLTGTVVSADKPIQVFGGHRCIYVPNATPYCDHIEETMPPVLTLAKEFLVTAPWLPNPGNVVTARMVRVIAVDGATNVAYDPAQGGAPTFLANTGDWFEIASTSADFQITADKRILVAEYLRGRMATASTVGDPSMAVAVGVDQFRPSYLFYAHNGYLNNYVNVVAPNGTTVTLDGVGLAGFIGIGATGFSVLRVELGPGAGGVHEITGTQPFGISVYGYGIDTSYWYPGGQNLELLPG
jgi:hypothetical protein